MNFLRRVRCTVHVYSAGHWCLSSSAAVAVTKCPDKTGAETSGRQQSEDMPGRQESERTRRHLVSAAATELENSSVRVNRPPPIHYVSRFILRGEHGHPGDTEPPI